MEAYDRVFPAAVRAVEAVGGTAYWKTTTATTNEATSPEFDALAVRKASEYGLRVFDAFALTRTLRHINPRPYW